MKWLLIFALVIGVDVLSYVSVPTPVRHANRWSIVPLGGIILAAEYHFGNKLKEAS